MIFAIVERTHTVAALSCTWDPMKLPPVRKRERKASLVNAVCQLVFAVFGLVWLLLLPHHPFLILGPAAAILKAAPMWHGFYLPMVLLTVLTILRPAIVLAKPEWNWFPSLGEAVQALLSLIVLNIILHVAGLTSGGDIQPFVVPTDAAKNSAQLAHVSAIVNVSILISLVCAWIGFCIALIVHTWKFIRALRKASPGSQQTASLQAH
jgi:hypothetical protein